MGLTALAPITKQIPFYNNDTECVQQSKDEHILNHIVPWTLAYVPYPSSIPRCFPPLVLQATVGGVKGLEMRLLRCTQVGEDTAMKHYCTMQLLIHWPHPQCTTST